ncbi:hypothetical protein CRI94_16930 [Longibacter salinarum]|uniref:Uncharacterized protein n=2 Tax=Longibacter salinarum TaxID=1850348 RepID=A0A2A8CTS2_9BACT|nr:hypothetical protein CRI94_16930 [Longibacter salinarum]
MSHLRRLFGRDKPIAASPESVAHCIETAAPNAFQALRDELDAFVERVEVYRDDGEIGILIQPDADADPFTYIVSARTLRVPNFAFPEINVAEDEARRFRAEVHVNGNRERKNVADWSEEALIRDVLTTYEEHVAWDAA